MISIDDFVEINNSLINKSQIQAITQVEKTVNGFGFHVIVWEKKRLLGEFKEKSVAEQRRTEWIQKNLKSKKSEAVCVGCGLVQE